MPAKSKAQQRFFGVVRGIQKGSGKGSKAAKDVAKQMDTDDVKKYASTKHKGLPNKVKQETRVRSLIRKMVREIMKEDFAGALKKEDRKEFDKKRQKQSEVLGYKLTGKSDVKTKIDDATIKEVSGVEKVLDMADSGFGKLAGKTVDGLSANLFKQVYEKASQSAKEKINKMNEKQLYVFMGKLWSKFGRQVKI